MSEPQTTLPSAERCPTCRAAWRGTVACTRCGADLTTVMQIAVKAWELRQAARAALVTDDQRANALEWARTACQLHSVPHGQRLFVLALLVHGQIGEACALLETLLEDSSYEKRTEC